MTTDRAALDSAVKAVVAAARADPSLAKWVKSGILDDSMS